jgi:hypothetical protein
METLQEQLDRAHEQLKIPPGATEATHQHAALASTLLCCLRYGGLADNEIRERLAADEPTIVTSWAAKLKRRRSPDARLAAHYLDSLKHEDKTQLHDAIALLAIALDAAGHGPPTTPGAAPRALRLADKHVMRPDQMKTRKEVVVTNGPPLGTPETDWTEQHQVAEVDDGGDEPMRAESMPLEADEADVQEQSFELPAEEDYPPVGEQ